MDTIYKNTYVGNKWYLKDVFCYIELEIGILLIFLIRPHSDAQGSSGR